MLASSSAAFNAKNSGTDSSRGSASRAISPWAIWFQCPGGDSVRGPSAQNSAMNLSRSVSSALKRTTSVT